MKDKGIQKIIKKAIEDYKNASIPPHLKYSEENFFYENKGIMQTILNKNNFKSICDCFKEFYEEKQFFFYGQSLKE